MLDVTTPSCQEVAVLCWWQIHLSLVLKLLGAEIRLLKAQSVDITGRMGQRHRAARAYWLPGVSLGGVLRDKWQV